MLSSLLLFGLATLGQAVNLTVSPTGGNATSPFQYGIMFEDINHSGDGGIYAELIQNRAFQGNPVFPSTIEPWVAVGSASLSLQNLSNPLSSALPTSLNVAAITTNGTSSSQTIGIKNPGWWGIDVKAQTYTGTFWANGSPQGGFQVSLESALTSDVWATAQVNEDENVGGWIEYGFVLQPAVDAPYSNNTFSLTWSDTTTSVNIGFVSLFPPTYKNRPNGMRIDIMEALKELSPSFLRMPGGNNIEGNEAPYLWYWNQTIGPLIDRPGRPGTWGYENTDGLGLIEYLHWCEDLEVEPILAIWDGLYLDKTVVSNASLQAYVQDSLNELEFLMGETSTPYGSLRASLGYPEPFPINYVEVGNEDQLNNGLSTYDSYRFTDYYNAITALYPNIKIIASTVANSPRPGNSGGDYHQYTRPDQFVDQYTYFDAFDPNHPTLLGEWACIQPNVPGGDVSGANFSEPRSAWPFWIGTVSEAVYLIGAERNTDKIIGASYAPLLQNVNSYEWAPDLISFSADPAQDVLSTSWHMIKLFSNTRSTTVLPVTADTAPSPGFWVAGVNSDSQQYILKAAVYNTTAPVPFSVSFGQTTTTANLTLLTAPDASSANVFNGTNQVISTVTELTSVDGTFSFDMPQWSIALLTTDGL